MEIEICRLVPSIEWWLEDQATRATIKEFTKSLEKELAKIAIKSGREVKELK